MIYYCKMHDFMQNAVVSGFARVRHATFGIHSPFGVCSVVGAEPHCVNWTRVNVTQWSCVVSDKEIPRTPVTPKIVFEKT